MKKQGKLPVFGVGPYFGIFVVTSAVLGIVLSIVGLLDSGKTENPIGIGIFWTVGILLGIGGLLLWAPSMLGKKSIDKYIDKDRLCTGGVYRYTRNPCYVGLTFLTVGAILLSHNLWLLLLPPIYYLVLTVLLKCTEEKWLAARYGEAYRIYCKKVNRIFPWFPKK